ncbi:MAG: FKBP-type peptidyl-prolyl cis-trans isomerase [Candidatus Aenigmatarchaeota archaeon]
MNKIMRASKKPVRKVKDGDNITVEYVGKLQDGKIFDKGKIEFEVGSGEMIIGFDSGVIGMTEGKSKVITISPNNGYGERDDSLMLDIPMQEFLRNNIKPVRGARFTIENHQGIIISVRDTAVTVDFNHFLAGKTLIFNVKVVRIV